MSRRCEVDRQIAEVPEEAADSVLLHEILSLRSHVPALLLGIAIVCLEQHVVIEAAIHEQRHTVPEDPVVDLASLLVPKILEGLGELLVVVDVLDIASAALLCRCV